MTDRALHDPHALVLGVGGVLGEAWITGVLGGIASVTGVDFREPEVVVGTSAGSIVAAYLTAGEPLRAPSQSDDGLPEQPAVSGSAGWGILQRAATLRLVAGAPLAPLVLAAATPGGALARAALLSRMPSGRLDLDGLGHRIDRLGVRFEGRLKA